MVSGALQMNDLGVISPEDHSGVLFLTKNG